MKLRTLRTICESGDQWVTIEDTTYEILEYNAVADQVLLESRYGGASWWRGETVVYVSSL